MFISHCVTFFDKDDYKKCVAINPLLLAIIYEWKYFVFYHPCFYIMKRDFFLLSMKLFMWTNGYFPLWNILLILVIYVTFFNMDDKTKTWCEKYRMLDKILIYLILTNLKIIWQFLREACVRLIFSKKWFCHWPFLMTKL